MIGEVALGGVYVPVLLVLAVLALLLTFVATRLLAHVGFYRLVAYRALVDVALFVLILGLVSLLTSSVGFAS